VKLPVFMGDVDVIALFFSPENDKLSVEKI